MKHFSLFAALALALPMAVVAAPPLLAKDTLTLGVVLEPPGLDPTAGAAAAIDEVVYANVFEGLTRIDETGTVQPALAKSWTVSDDGKTYRFSLHEGVKFHDGTTFDADDVVFSIKRATADDSTNAQKALFSAIENVAADGANTVVITLSRPQGEFLFNMGWGDAVIVAPESAADNNANPVGTGPFQLSKWMRGDRIELMANADYWGEKPALTKVTFKFIPDPAAAFASLQAGDVDAFPNFPAPENLAQFESDPRFTVEIGSTEGETILSTNNKSGPFADVRVRRAIAHVLDRQAIIDGAMFGYGTIIGTHFAPHNPAYVDLTGLYPRNLGKARALLAEAGYPDGFSATIKLPPPSYARRGGEIIAAQLKEVGIKLEIIPVEWAQWLDQVFRNKDYDLTIVSHTEPMDINIYARPDYYFQYENADFNSTIEMLGKADDPAERNALLGKAQRMLAEDAVNGFLFQLAKHGVWDAKLRGMWKNSPVQANDLTKVHWAD
ncbi:MAG: ABC transporter substrate-binding protein [Rhizobiales bacterium]|nr:ABC transporter substrate-binding protein [Hyphomicrobiales bacterium]